MKRVSDRLRWVQLSVRQGASAILRCIAIATRFEQAKVPHAVLTNRRRKPGPKGPSVELIHAVVEMKQRNPNWGCPRIAQQIVSTRKTS